MAYKDLGPNQRAWVRALRSGKYGQIAGALQGEGDRYCCLGVGCKVAGRKGIIIGMHNDCIRGETLQFQPNVRYFLGLRDEDGVPEGSLERLDKYVYYIIKVTGMQYASHRTSLVDLNDDYGLDFHDIAGVLVKFSDLFFKESV